MRYLLTVPGKFHLNSIIEDFLESTDFVKMLIITSSPKVKINNERVKVIWVPMFFQIIFRKLLKIHQPSFFKYLDFILFDFICTFFVRTKTINIGFAGISLLTGKKSIKKGGQYILDRACPYFPVQYNLIKNEYNLSGLNAPVIKKYLLKRLMEEYNICSKIMVPSTFSANTYPKSIRGKVILYKLRIKKLESLNKSYQEERNGIPLVFGFIGGDYVRKGTNTLIDAFTEVFDKYKNINLSIKMHKPEFLKTEKAKIFFAQYSHRLNFINYLPKISAFYSNLDYLVLPSIDEGFGMVVMESLLCSTPVIISNNVGCKDHISSNKFNLIFQTNDKQDLINKIESAIILIKSKSKDEIHDFCLEEYQLYYNIKRNYFETIS